MSINGINHVALRVRDLDQAEAFYAGLLGLKRVGERPGMRFYSSGRFAHELALVQVPGLEITANSGLAHVCFNLDDEADLYALHDRSVALGFAPSELVDHRVTHAFYLQDPSGNLVELGVERPAEEWRSLAEPFARDYRLVRGASGAD